MSSKVKAVRHRRGLCGSPGQNQWPRFSGKGKARQPSPGAKSWLWSLCPPLPFLSPPTFRLPPSKDSSDSHSRPLSCGPPGSLGPTPLPSLDRRFPGKRPGYSIQNCSEPVLDAPSSGDPLLARPLPPCVFAGSCCVSPDGPQLHVSPHGAGTSLKA